VHDPDGAPWEVYTVIADAEEAGDVRFELGLEDATPASACCTVDEPACAPATGR